MFTYEDLVDFVEKNGYQNMSFHKVIELYNREMNEAYESMQADEYLATIESHEIIWYG